MLVVSQFPHDCPSPYILFNTILPCQRHFDFMHITAVHTRSHLKICSKNYASRVHKAIRH